MDKDPADKIRTLKIRMWIRNLRMWKLLQNPSRAVVIFSLTGADKHLADVNNSVINPCRTTAILTRAGLQLY